MSTTHHNGIAPRDENRKQIIDCPLCGERVGELPDHIRHHCRIAEAHRRLTDDQTDLTGWSR